MWLGLAVASGSDWWTRLVPRDLRGEAERRAQDDGGSKDPELLARRIEFMQFIKLFERTFPGEFSTVFPGSPKRVAFVLECLKSARDGAGHIGKPLLLAEAQLAVALARECVTRIPPVAHDPPSLEQWFASIAFGENEGFHADEYDCAADRRLISSVIWADLHRISQSFRPTTTTGDQGYASAAESLLAANGLDVFLRAGELRLGTGMPAFSGLFHEHDLGVRGERELVIFELKNRRGGINKNDLLTFNQKTIDFQLMLIRQGDPSRFVRALMTTSRQVPIGLRTYCLQWGIVLVDPLALPVPALVAAFRDLSDTPAAADPLFAANDGRAERLGSLIRPLDTILRRVPL